jgi:branched-chain amino acid transport system substrate-binding protein
VTTPPHCKPPETQSVAHPSEEWTRSLRTPIIGSCAVEDGDRGMHINRRAGVAAMLGAAFGATLPSSRIRAAEVGVTPTEVIIGQNITLQAGKNAYGNAARDGIAMHLEAVNAAGGVNGRTLVLRTLDDDNTAANAEANARRLVAEGAFILFGSIEGGPSTAVAKVAEESQVPFFGPMAGSPTLRRPHSPMVFPVRAEHREEFRALMDWGKRTGLKSVGFFHADGEVGRQHLENVRRLTQEMGMTLRLPMPFKSDMSDAAADEMAAALAQAAPDMVFNHGSAGPYGRLIVRARRLGVKAAFMAVNSGSTQLAAGLGPLAHGMVFAQVVPSPIERKHELSREYQAALQRSRPGAPSSYGGLEGYITAKALVAALRAAGRGPTRASFIQALYRTKFDLGGLGLRYAPGAHDGSSFVDLSLYSRENRFIHPRSGSSTPEIAR